MLADALRIWSDERPTLLREAAGLVALCVAIVASLYLPILV